MMADQIALGEIFNGNDNIGHGFDGAANQIRPDQQSSFHLPKLADAEPQENYSYAKQTPTPGR
jgi:hypothetical protein